MLKKLMIAATALMGTQAALAIELFETNPTQPYPPGCISTSTENITTPTGGRQVYAQDILTFPREGSIDWSHAHGEPA